jgi:ABC-type antimicrobial peptide transport system permease subunit
MPLPLPWKSHQGREYSVIGVAKDAQVAHLGQLDTNYLYFPADKGDDSRSYILVRYSTGFADLEVWRAPSRIVAALSGALGSLALLLCSIGVYGMVSYSVSRSVRDIGIRMALGADGAKVMRLVVWQAMHPVVIGAIIGAALCAAVSGVLRSMMFGLGTHDPIAFIGMPVFLLAVALVATLIPGRRAMRVDPMVALRCE